MALTKVCCKKAISYLGKRKMVGDPVFMRDKDLPLYKKVDAVEEALEGVGCPNENKKVRGRALGPLPDDDETDDVELEIWTHSLTPEKYLQNYPKGPRSALAKKLIRLKQAEQTKE